MTQTYTVYSATSGCESERNLTAVQAAEAILGHDGHDYELRHEDGGAYSLYISRYSRNRFGGNGGFTQAYAYGRRIFSAAATEETAWADIADQVIGAQWDSGLQAMTDADYDAMMQNIAEGRA